jgi:hypothetical protein
LKFIDGIAILGALAWAPHLITLIKNHFTKPKVRIITSRSAELGFTSMGPILNLHLAFSVEHKDIVVSDLKIRLKHESGEERVFEWQGIKQNVGKMTTPDAGSMPFEKEQSVLAIKLNQTQIEERFIRFQDVAFIASKKEYENTAVKKIAYLKAENKYNAEDFLREQEMTELYNFNKHSFPWKEGEYTASIEVQSPEKFILADNIRNFSLSPVDIEELSKNRDVLEADYKRLLVGQKEGEPDIVWQWRSPALVKT